MIQVPLIGPYVHVSFGNYEENLFPLHPEDTLASLTGIILDGALDEHTVLLGAVILNWGFAIGISLKGHLQVPERSEP